MYKFSVSINVREMTLERCKDAISSEAEGCAVGVRRSLT